MVICVTTAAFLAAAAATAGETLHDPQLGFTLTVPDGFRPDPELAASNASFAHAFVRPAESEESLNTLLFIERLNGTIGREPLKAADLPAGSPASLSRIPWGEFEIDVIRFPEEVNQLAAVTYNAQVPLKRQAIQVRLFGPAERESELQSLLAQTVSSLQGETNWIPSAPIGSPVAQSENYGFVLLAVALLAVLGGLVGLWLVSRVAPRGIVLAMAVVIYLVGVALDGIRIREVLLICGAFKMLGFAGGILGVVDLLRRRPATRPTRA